jgi:hypothetical protein
MRLFMVPGMGHCGGGPGVNMFDSIGALEKWVEKGIAPDRMVIIVVGFFRFPRFRSPQGSKPVR